MLDKIKKGILFIVSISVILGLGYFIYINKTTIITYFNQIKTKQAIDTNIKDIKQNTITNSNNIQKLVIINTKLYKKYLTLIEIIKLQQQQIQNLKINHKKESEILDKQNQELILNKKSLLVLNKKSISLISNQNKIIDNLNEFKSELNSTSIRNQKEVGNLTKQIEKLQKQIKKLQTKKQIIDLGFSYVGFAVEKGIKVGYISINSGRIYSVKTDAIINEIYKVISIDKNVLIIQNQNNHKVYTLDRKK